jgi:hypothetical protein
MDSVSDLLRRLWRLNQEDGIQQSRSDPSDPTDEIATLAGAARLSPMLKERYAFAGTWRKAALDQNWLALEDIDAAIIRTRASREFHARTASSAFRAELSRAQVALFGINHGTNEATYLIWAPGREEPAICAYYGGRSDLFGDLQRFLAFLVGDLVHDDSLALVESGVIEAGSLPVRQTA